ncbi:ABC transporter permease [Candidatus Hydrogenedentota bacterium]
MILQIARKELLAHILSFRFSVFLILLFLLTLGSVAVMTLKFNDEVASYRDGVSQIDRALSEYANIRDLQNAGLTSRKGPNRLGFFSEGIEKLLARPVSVVADTGVEIAPTFETNPILSLFPTPDLIYIVNIVLSLIALLSTYDAVCGESERGTLKLVLSNSVPKYKLILGKWLGGYLSVILPFTVSVLAGLALIFALADVSFNSNDTIRIILLVLLCLIYISVFFNLGLFISSSTRRTGTAMMICLFAWVFIVLAYPNTSPMVARLFVSAQNPSELLGSIRASERDLNSEYFQRRAELDKNDKAKFLAGLHDLKVDIGQRTRKEKYELERDYIRQMQKQVDVAQVFSQVSPSSSFVLAASTLTRSGLRDYERIIEYYDDYESEFREALKELNKKAGKPGKKKIQDVLMAKETNKEAAFDITVVPKFDFQGIALEEAIENSLPGFVLLIVFNTVFFLGAFLQFIRYRVH